MTTAEDYDSDRDRFWGSAVTALTAAARLEHPKYGTIDFADFLTSALRATAANLGGPRAISARRPGSWESATLDQMLQGALGFDPGMFELAQYRTEPIHVPLHVANLVFHNAEAPGAPEEFDDAIHAAGDDAERTALIARQYTTAYQSYAGRFIAAVRAEAAKHPGLTELVTTAVDTSLHWAAEAEIDNPTQGDCDPLVWHFWSTARRSVGPPTIPEAPFG